VAVLVRADDVGEVLAVRVFHDDVVDALGLPELVDLEHVLMDEVGHELGLADEEVDVLLVLQEFALDRLDRHHFAETLGAELLGEVDRAHATGCDLAQDLVVGEVLDLLRSCAGSGSW